ncbi:M28 family peptidase [Sphingomonas endophytica]|uniref:Aminopeptidase n=1 Tax=Sphingomonas endophytica TaxID=869719 RepID=A0A147I5P9_9SPHN|nr:M28 family peptidase [Sphingomonas endophytica]KTT74072.1 aminopeptidase [Sphingomonas endophytica]
MPRFLALPLFLSLIMPAAAQTPAERNARLTAPLPADQAAVKAHVMFLASDAMKGRDVGSPEFDIAAQYVAAQFYAAGLKPMGDDGGYLQHVPLTGYTLDGQGRFAVTARGGGATPLGFGVDYVPAANPAAKATAIAAPVVFVGYGLEAPAYGLNDYAGVDVRGKIVAYVGGAPAGLPSEVAATFGSSAARQSAAAKHGAVGVIVIADLRKGGRGAPSFAAATKGYAAERITWARPDGTGQASDVPMLGTLSPAGAAKLFGRSWPALAKGASRATLKVRPATSAATLSVSTATTFRPIASANVVGMLPGSDPTLAKETVVLSAHLDHVGVGKAVDGDTIYNGALDDGIGIASLIEAARRFKTASPPKRGIIFLAVTAEEKGLVGSDYFANHPRVPIRDIVADVNLDMPILTYVFEDMVAFGGDRSTLGPIIARAVAGIGVTLSPDPMPEQAIFVRSDHYRFVQKGVPSVFLWPGYKGPGKAAVETFMSRCYHKPCDDLTQPIRWDQAVRFVDANYRIAREIADAPTRPVWNSGDYFGTLFDGPMAR